MNVETDKREKQLCLCIDNEEYPASLEINKLYLMLPDEGDEELDMIRVIDESGKDYLYPKDYFVVLPREFFNLLHFTEKTRRRIIRALNPA